MRATGLAVFAAALVVAGVARAQLSVGREIRIADPGTDLWGTSLPHEVAYSSGIYAAVRTDEDGAIWLGRFDELGNQLDPITPLVARGVFPILAGGPAGFLVVWAGSVTDASETHLLASALSLDGRMSTDPPLDAGSANGPASMTFDAGVFRVYTQCAGGLCVRTIDPSATHVDGPWPVPEIEAAPTACVDGVCLTVWNDFTGASYAVRVSGSDVLDTPPFPLPVASCSNRTAALDDHTFFILCADHALRFDTRTGVVTGDTTLTPAEFRWGAATIPGGVAIGSIDVSRSWVSIVAPDGSVIEHDVVGRGEIAPVLGGTSSFYTSSASGESFAALDGTYLGSVREAHATAAAVPTIAGNPRSGDEVWAAWSEVALGGVGLNAWARHFTELLSPSSAPLVAPTDYPLASVSVVYDGREFALTRGTYGGGYSVAPLSSAGGVGPRIDGIGAHPAGARRPVVAPLPSADGRVVVGSYDSTPCATIVDPIAGALHETATARDGTILAISAASDGKIVGIFRDPTTDELVSFETTASGDVRGEHPLGIDAAGHGVGDPHLVWDGTQHWLACTLDGRAQVVRIDTTGVPIDSVPTPVIDDVARVDGVTFDGASVVVLARRAVVGQSWTNELLAARVAPDGTVRDTAPVVVAPDIVSSEEAPSIGSLGGGTAVVSYLRVTGVPWSARRPYALLLREPPACLGDVDCDDAASCTVDTCSNEFGCTHALIPGCVPTTTDGGPPTDAGVADDLGGLGDAAGADDDDVGDARGAPDAGSTHVSYGCCAIAPGTGRGDGRPSVIGIVLATLCARRGRRVRRR